MTTTFREVQNRGLSTLNGLVTSFATTWTVVSGSSFPASNFMVTCENEIALCTGRVGNVLTVTRAQDGTSASAHPSGASVESRIVSSLFADIHTAINNLEGTGIISMPSALQTLAAGTTILANALTIQIGSGSDVTLTANPLIADGSSDGQLLFIWNVGAFSITLNTNNLQFGADNTPPTLGPYDTVLLQWSTSASLWLMQVTTSGGGSSIPATRQWIIDDFEAKDPPGSPTAWDDEFDDTTGNSGTINGLNARWTWVNQGGATITYPNPGWMQINVPASAGINWRIIDQAIPAATSYTFEAKFSFSGYGVNGSNSGRGGFVLRDGVNGDFYSVGLEIIAQQSRVEVVKWTNVTTYSGAGFDVGNATHESAHGPNSIYVRIEYDLGTNFFIMSVSQDGIGWHTMQAGWTDVVGVTRIGLAMNETANTGRAKLHCDYFRRIA